MKKVFKLFVYSAIAAAVAASCTPDPAPDAGTGNEGDNGKEPSTEKTAPELKEESLNAVPTGDTLVFDLKATAAWTIEPGEECDWVTVEPESGTGDAEVIFYVSENTSDRDRSISFFVSEAETETHKAGETYEIFISQVKMEIPIVEGDYEFLKWLVDNRAYGDATPDVDWYSFTGEGFTGINFNTDAAGKFFIQSISFVAREDTPSSAIFNSFPPEVNLQNCEDIYINCTADGTDAATMAEWMKCALKGSEFPTEWNCPKLWRLHLECVGMQGVISESLAALPALEQLFIRCCDVYGALPHEWKSPVLTNLVLGYGGAAADCPNMGYIVPAQFDIILNSERTEAIGNRMRDLGGIHLAGAPEGWLGYEEGWGQKRYEKFDANAEKGNKAVWSDFRGLTEAVDAAEVAAGGIRNPQGTDNAWYIDSWAWFFQRMSNQPKELLVWDKAAADAFTAEAKAKERIFTR